MRKRTLLFLIWLCLCLPAAAGAEQTVVLSLLGDCTIGSEEAVRYWENGFAKVAEREGYAYFFQEVQPLLSADDVTIANFEGVLKKNAYLKVKKTYNFRGLPAYADILSLGGVDAVGLSNNHTGDYGSAGMRTTKEALLAGGVSYFDDETVYMYEKNGIQIGFLSVWQQWMFQKGKQYAQTVTDLKASGVNAVVVYVHFGQEYNHMHLERQTSTAQLFIDAGADLVAGSHPHVLQGVELYQNRLILYSLGNFVFGGNAKVRALETMIPQVTFTFSDDGDYLSQQLRVYPAHVSGDAVYNDYQPRLVTGEAAEAVYRLLDQDSEGLPVAFTTHDTYREYAQIPAANDDRY